MSDTKLREKADALIAFTQQGPRFIAWVEAVTDSIAPAPEKVAKVETMADRIAADLKAGTFRGEQPAPPAPEKAAKVECPNCGEMTERSHSRYEGPGPDKWACQPAPPEPAAREMPEAVRVGTFQLEELLKWADLAEVSLRTGFAPPTFLGMDLPHLLRISIAAVRQQAAQGRNVELGKVREFFDWLEMSEILGPSAERLFQAALAELDAAEGKVAG